MDFILTFIWCTIKTLHLLIHMNLYFFL
jgi:hypothetical protein